MSLSSNDSDRTLIAFNPMKNDFEFTSIDNADIVELSAVQNPSTVWVRAVKYDELYHELLTKNNSNVAWMTLNWTTLFW